jgi:hypothetical protein
MASRNLQKLALKNSLNSWKADCIFFRVEKMKEGEIVTDLIGSNKCSICGAVVVSYHGTLVNDSAR